MTNAWVEISTGADKRRHELPGGLSRFGGPTSDLPVPQPGADELHFWNDPPKLILVGGTTTPLVNGRAFQEVALADGDSVQWGGAVLVFSVEDDVLTEIELTEPVSASGPPGRVAPVVARPGVAVASAPATVSAAGPEGMSGDAARSWRRLFAGLLVELKLANKAETKRWQASVLRNEFDADACARDLIEKSGVPENDPRVLERAGRLERDLLMSSFQQGVRAAGRRARRAAKGGAAFFMVQGIAILVYTLLIVAMLLLARVRYEISLDGIIDSMLEAVTPGSIETGAAQPRPPTPFPVSSPAGGETGRPL